MTNKEKDFHKKADREIQVMEELGKWLPDNIKFADAEIARRVEERFGISADRVLARFNQRLHETTFASIMACYND